MRSIQLIGLADKNQTHPAGTTNSLKSHAYGDGVLIEQNFNAALLHRSGVADDCNLRGISLC